MTEAKNAQVLATAQFDPKVKVYWYVQGLVAHAALVFAVIGVFTLPIWIVTGWFISGKRYEAITAELTPKAIHLKQGIWFRVEKTIPLEKIQDLSLSTGPLLDAFGLASLQIETAGGAAPNGGSDMMLPGLSNATEFRNAVLAQRDRVADREPAQIAAPSEADATVVLLTDIRDTLKRLEARLDKAETQASTPS